MVIMATAKAKKNVELLDKIHANLTKVWSSQCVGPPFITLLQLLLHMFHVKFISISLTVTVIV